MKPILLIGGGGHCISCIDVIEQGGEYEVAGIVDLPEKKGEFVLGYPIIGCDDDLEHLLNDTPHCLITLGQIKSAALRKRLYFRVRQAQGALCTIISPSAYVSPHAQIGPGSIIMHYALVNAGVKVGENCIINTRAVLEHETRVGNHCHVSTNTTLNGQVLIQDETFVGSGTTINNGVRVCSGAVIGAGSLVLRDIDRAGTYVGMIS